MANGYILGSVALQREEILEVSLDKSQRLEVGYRENFKVEEQPGKRSIVEEKSLEKWVWSARLNARAKISEMGQGN